MSIDPRKIINSPLGLNLAYLIGRCTPDWFGPRIAFFLADRIAARSDWMMVRAVRANQWVVGGEQLDKGTLDKLVATNFRTVASSIYDMYHNLYNPAVFLHMIEP